VSFHVIGTAGVWRISALNEAGGWKDRTTVEDMDLAVRATLSNWKFVYVGNIKVIISSFNLSRKFTSKLPCRTPNYLVVFLMTMEIS